MRLFVFLKNVETFKLCALNFERNIFFKITSTRQSHNVLCSEDITNHNLKCSHCFKILILTLHLKLPNEMLPNFETIIINNPYST